MRFRNRRRRIQRRFGKIGDSVKCHKHTGFLSYGIGLNYVVVSKKNRKLTPLLLIRTAKLETHRLVLIEKTIPWMKLTEDVQYKLSHRINAGH